ncbi:MAG: FecR domain-containing protein [Candidatus Omnitrophota bacterium]
MKSLKVVCVLILSLLAASAAFSAEARRTAKITSITGEANVKPDGQEAWTSAAKGMILNEGDMLKTGKDSTARVNLDGDGETATVDISPNSNLMLAELLQDKEKGTQTTLLDLALGEILIKAEKLHTTESKFEVKTPTSVVGVRGTKFSVKVEALEENPTQ